MNANIEMMLKYHRGNFNKIIVTEKGYYLSNKEAKAYLRWGLENGYKDLYSMPEFEEIKDELKIYV